MDPKFPADLINYRKHELNVFNHGCSKVNISLLYDWLDIFMPISFASLFGGTALFCGVEELTVAAIRFWRLCLVDASISLSIEHMTELKFDSSNIVLLNLGANFKTDI